MKIVLFISLMLIAGCAGSTGNIYSDSEIIRGCSYIACAIVTHGVLQALFRQ